MAHKEQWVFCGQVKGLHPEYFENTTLDSYKKDVLNWNKFWPNKFKNKLDIASIFKDDNFLEKINVPIDESKKFLFENWKKFINENIKTATRLSILDFDETIAFT